MPRLEEFDDVQLDVEFTQAGTRSNLTSNENIAISFGKISKWYEALVPTGGSSGQFLAWNSSGTAKWVANPNVDTKVTSTLLAQSTAAATYLPTFVSAAGNSGVNIMNSFSFRHTVGTTVDVGNSRIVLGNATASGTANNEEGKIVLYSSGTSYHTLKGGATSSAVTHMLPTTGGTVLNTGTTSFTQTLTSGTKIGSIKINGTSTDIYAPTVNDAALTLKGDGTTVTTFTANASSAKSLDIVAGSNVTVTADTTNAKISIASSHPTITTSTDTTSTASPAHGGTFTTVDSVTRDGNGHVTKINTKTVTLPADSNTDTLVSQTFATADRNRPLLMSYYDTGVTTTTAQVVHRNDTLYFNPSSGVLRSPRLYLQTTGMAITINLDTLQPTAGENVNVLAVKYKNTDGTATHTVYPIGILGNDATGTVNSGVRLGSTNGTTVVGAGESSYTFAAAQVKYNDESLYLVADQAVYMYTSCSNDSTTVTGPWRVGGFTTGTSAITSGRVMITDGTTGGFKASDYTIAKSVPSDAEFSDTTYSAGTGLSLSGTTFNHSNSVTAVTSAVFKKITYDAQGHITGTANVVAADIPSLDYSKVSITRNLTSGTKVGTITIDGTSTDLYCQTNSNTTYTLSGAYGSSSNTWVTTLTPSSGTATTSTVPTASTSVYGITKLSSATNSTSTALAATPSAVKSAYDLANGKSTVSFSASLTTGTKVGTITIDGTDTDIYCETNTNTDTKVTDTVGTANTYYPAGGTSTSTATGTQVFDTSLKFIGTTGTTSAVGKAQLVLGNSTASGTANNKQGSIVVYGSTAYAHTIQGAPTAARTLTLPNKTGTVAVTSDIPTVNDATLTLKGAGTTVTSFTANSSSDASLDIVAGSNVTVTADTTNAKISIASSHPTITTSTDTTSTASPAHGGTFTTVDSVTRDGNGHVTKINTKTVTLPADSNTDTKVTQTNTTTSADYRVLLSGNANDTTETTTGRKSTNLKFNPNTGVLSASNGVTTKTITRSALKGMLTGSGTAAQDKGSGVSPRYFPAQWTFNTGLTAANGDVFIIKLPTAGHSYGVFLSIDNGANYYPISVNGTSRLTTHYGNGYSIAVMFKSDGSTADMYPLAGGDSRSTVTGGCWQVLNYYDSGNTYTSAYCTTAAATAAKTATCSSYNLLSKSWLHITIVNSNTAASALTLNVNSKGAKPIYINGSASSSSNYTLAAGTYLVYYDGTNYYFRNDGMLTASITGNASSSTQIYSELSDGRHLNKEIPFYRDSSALSGYQDLYHHHDFKVSISAGSTNTNATINLIIGNATASGTAGAKQGLVQLYGTGTLYGLIAGPPSGTTGKTINHPGAEGTIMLREDMFVEVTATKTYADGVCTINTGLDTASKYRMFLIEWSTGIESLTWHPVKGSTVTAGIIPYTTGGYTKHYTVTATITSSSSGGVITLKAYDQSGTQVSLSATGNVVPTNIYTFTKA